MTAQLNLFGSLPEAPKPAPTIATPEDVELDAAVATVAYGYLGDTGLKHGTSYQAAMTLRRLRSLPQLFHTSQFSSDDRDGIKELQKRGLATVSSLPGKMARVSFKRAPIIALAEEYDRLTLLWVT